MDGLFLHLEDLDVSLWQRLLALMQQMLQRQQAKTAGLCLPAVVSMARLLRYAADVCADLEQTEQLVALLVQSYVQPQSDDTGKPCDMEN